MTRAHMCSYDFNTRRRQPRYCPFVLFPSVPAPPASVPCEGPPSTSYSVLRSPDDDVCGLMYSARLLVEKAGADSRARAKVMHEPLHVACLGNWGQVVKFLLSEGDVDVEAADKNGMRSLHLAVQRNRLEAIRELLKHGCGGLSVAVALVHVGQLGRGTFKSE